MSLGPSTPVLQLFLTRFSSLYSGVHQRRCSRHVVVEGGAANGSVLRATLSSPFDPSHPLAEGGMPRPRLPFGITSTSSTSRLITLSAWMVVGASRAGGGFAGVGRRWWMEADGGRCWAKKRKRRQRGRKKKRIMK